MSGEPENHEFRVVLIEPRSPGIHVFARYKMPRLGLPILGALVKRELGIEPKIYIEEIGGIDWEEVLGADLVGISAITPNAPGAYGIIKRIKDEDAGITVVMGGPHATFMPDEALENGADFVVRGEGEWTFLELAGQLSRGELEPASIKSLSFMKNGAPVHNEKGASVQELSMLPWPDISLIQNFGKARVVPIMTSRGCPYDCKFCSVTSMFGRRYRFRDTEDVIEELRGLYEKYPKCVFFFYDDNFTANPARTRELVSRMKEEGITPRWTAQARVDVVNDAELVKLMSETGCEFLYLGMESINPETLREYRKSQTIEDIEKSVGIIHKCGIKVHGMFVLGSDEDDMETIKETVRFSKKTGIDTVQYCILTPYPGTEVYEEMSEQGRIFVEDWSKYSGHHVVYYPKNMPAFQLQKAATFRAMRKFYSYWQCWKLGILFRWDEIALRVYAKHTISKWKSANKNFVSELKKRYKREKAAQKKAAKKTGSRNLQPPAGAMNE